MRADKDLVRQAIFHAFEKHQYYRLVDLQKLTNQPPVRSLYKISVEIQFIERSSF